MKEPRAITVRRIAPAFADARGTITDVLQDVAVTDATIITTRAGAVRGNHFHKETRQFLYMLEGRMRLTTRYAGHRSTSVVLEKGDLVVSEPGEQHAMRALEDMVWLVLSSGPRGGTDFESDTFRLAAEDLLERPD